MGDLASEKLFLSINEKTAKYLPKGAKNFYKTDQAQMLYILPMMAWLEMKQSQLKFDLIYKYSRTSLRQPVFQNTKSFPVKSLFFEPLVSGHIL